MAAHLSQFKMLAEPLGLALWLCGSVAQWHRGTVAQGQGNLWIFPSQTTKSFYKTEWVKRHEFSKWMTSVLWSLYVACFVCFISVMQRETERMWSFLLFSLRNPFPLTKISFKELTQFFFIASIFFHIFLFRIWTLNTGTVYGNCTYMENCWENSLILYLRLCNQI